MYLYTYIRNNVEGWGGGLRNSSKKKDIKEWKNKGADNGVFGPRKGGGGGKAGGFGGGDLCIM